MAVTLINGKSYSHDQIVFQMFGVPILSLSDLSMNTSQEKGYNYGTTQNPISYGVGKKNPVEVSFTMSKNDYEALASSAIENDVLNFDIFDIPLTFLNPQAPTTDVLKNVLLTGVDTSSSEGDMDTKVAFTAIATHIDKI